MIRLAPKRITEPTPCPISVMVEPFQAALFRLLRGSGAPVGAALRELGDGTGWAEISFTGARSVAQANSRSDAAPVFAHGTP